MAWLLAKAIRQDAGTNIPVARNRTCEAGLSWGILLLSLSEFPGQPTGRMFRPALIRRALACLGFWALDDSYFPAPHAGVIEDVARRSVTSPSGICADR
jgi:hypothetical protein